MSRLFPYAFLGASVSEYALRNMHLNAMFKKVPVLQDWLLFLYECVYDRAQRTKVKLNWHHIVQNSAQWMYECTVPSLQKTHYKNVLGFKTTDSSISTKKHFSTSPLQRPFHYHTWSSVAKVSHPVSYNVTHAIRSTLTDAWHNYLDQNKCGQPLSSTHTARAQNTWITPLVAGWIKHKARVDHLPGGESKTWG